MEIMRRHRNHEKWQGLTRKYTSSEGGQSPYGQTRKRSHFKIMFSSIRLVFVSCSQVFKGVVFARSAGFSSTRAATARPFSLTCLLVVDNNGKQHLSLQVYFCRQKHCFQCYDQICLCFTCFGNQILQPDRLRKYARTMEELLTYKHIRQKL